MGIYNMKCFAALLFRLSVSLILNVCIYDSCLAQEALPTKDQILQVWTERQAKVASARFNMKVERTIHEGYSDLMKSPKKRAKIEPSSPNPPTDLLVAGDEDILINGSKLRYSSSSQQWDPSIKSLYPASHVEVF